MFGLSDEKRDELNERFKQRQEKLREEELTKEDKFRAVLRDRFDVNDDRAVKLAIGVEELGEEWGEAAEANRQELESAYGVDFDSLKAILRNWEKTGRMAELDASDGGSDAPLSDYPDSDRLPEFAKKVGDAFVRKIKDDGKVLMDKKDAETVKAFKGDLVTEVAEETGIPERELDDMSISSLQKMADSDSPDRNSVPAPKSKSAKMGNSIPEGKTEKAAKLREQKEFLEDRSGVLAEKRLEHIEEELNELKS